MPKILQLSPHIANMIAAGEVVERPASVVKELLENAVDAGASKVTVEIRNGGMTFLRVTDNGCGMSPEDARTAFLRHATSKLRTAEDLASITTMGFRGEALAAIASVSRIDLLTKTTGSISGTALHLDAGTVTEESEAGCPEGTTIIIRDLFFNTPARMKFMKSDSVEGSRVTAAVQLQALAHPEVSFTFIRDGKQVLQTPGTGGLEAAVYCVYGRECAKMIKVESRWEGYSLRGYVSKPTDARPSRNLQTFFVNDRPVRSRLLISALEEAYRNQIMVGKFPACVLHLSVPATAVDVNVHPAKTEVKFLSEKAVFDCVHYGVLGALNKTPDRPQVQLPKAPVQTPPLPPKKEAAPLPPKKEAAPLPARKEGFFRTMNSEEYQNFTAALQGAPKPSPAAAAATVAKLEIPTPAPLKERVMVPQPAPEPVAAPVPSAPPAPPREEEAEQVSIPMPKADTWRMVGELYRSYILVEEGDNAFLIDKHAAHERILFDKLKANQEAFSSQTLLTPVAVRLSPEVIGELLSNRELLEELGFEVESFGESTVIARQIPMDLAPEDAADALETIAADLMSGRRESRETVRDEILHTVACKAAIKAGWKSDEQELLALVKQVMERDDLKHCPHGRPICITLSKKQLEKQFKRS
ncbi:MAG: DNA mismatch repair endonuclease MutL [Oscillospiraceae bacterium]|nr:DNA mismatch repair endonuclease MutL [Oscillospiraceae bacterium]